MSWQSHDTDLVVHAAIIHVAVADVDAAYGAYAAAEHNTFNNTNNSNNTAYNNANNNANNDGKTWYLKQHRKPPRENHLSESSTITGPRSPQAAYRNSLCSP